MPKHFVLQGYYRSERFTSPSSGGSDWRPPMRDRAKHSAHLLKQLEVLNSAANGLAEYDDKGLTIEFEGFPGIDLAIESLAFEPSGIELRNVRTSENTTFATVFVPDGKLQRFERLITDYVERKKDKRGRALDHQRLIDTIRNIRAATIRSLWTDTDSLPTDHTKQIWWEVWIPVRSDRHTVLDQFVRLILENDLTLAKGVLEFPERTIVLVHASIEQFQQDARLLNLMAELRRAKETADFFESLAIDEQAEWVTELLTRITFSPEGADVPCVCVLDTGANRGHPLLASSLSTADQHTIEPGWGVDDADGHGTNMAGLSLLGDLTPLLEANDPISVPFRLESVKLLDSDGGNEGDSRHHGFLTTQAVARPEITNPNRIRTFSLAVSTRDGRDRGRPSSWSAAVDGLAAGTDTENATVRLILVAAGNSEDPSAYPAGNSADSIHDPGQSWNAITIGAFSELTRISGPDTEGYQPVAENGALSPHSTTSAEWRPEWPLKPDVVFEGGNVGTDGRTTLTMPCLSLLTTHHEPTQRLLTTAEATSAATALGARMAVQLQSEYPHLRPETIRALIVQSADWTPAMRSMYLPSSGVEKKADVANLVRHCGFGVPNLVRARESSSNSLTLIAERTITPFLKDADRIKSNEMHLHELPWPIDELLNLGETEVEMRATLSYFVEPNPSARSQKSQYRYQSHGLRFDIRRPQEATANFLSRINKAVRDEDIEFEDAASEDSGWLLGSKARCRGSIHSDIWRGSAADLADRGVLAIYPALGWWRLRPGLKRFDSTASYSLVVSISTPRTGVDLYTAIASQLGITIEGVE